MKEKNNNTEDKSRKVLVTLPPKLYDQLNEQAKKEMRSLSNMVGFVLQGLVNEQASAQVVNIQE